MERDHGRETKRHPLPVLQPHWEARVDRLRRGEGEAYQLQVEYMAWRRAHGLEPTADQLNAFELAWDRIGERLGEVD